MTVDPKDLEAWVAYFLLLDEIYQDLQSKGLVEAI